MDESSFEAFVRREAPLLLGIARHILDNERDAREAVQRAFAAAGETNGQEPAVMRRLALDAALAVLRARPHPAEHPIDDLLPRFLPSGQHTERFVPWPDAVGDGANRESLLTTVRAALADVPESFRVPLVLHDVEGLSIEETAAALGLPPNAVKIRLHRARLALRTRLAERWHGAAS